MKTEVAHEKVRRIALPDWGSIDTVRQHSLPFALWTVGEQCLLYHWLDAAVDEGIEKLIILVADRPTPVREALASAQLWPIQYEVVAIPRIEVGMADAMADWLPNRSKTCPDPQDGWSLIQYWQELERDWLLVFHENTSEIPLNLAIGRNCEIHPSVQLNPPFWVGDFVSIGPGTTVGPNAVIESGSLVAGNSRIVDSHIGKSTFLGPSTELSKAVLEGHTLLSLKNSAKVSGLDFLIAGNLGKNPIKAINSPSLKERILAFRLWWNWRGARKSSALDSYSIQGIDGEQWTLYKGPLWESRRPLLKSVWTGKIRLFGVVPRSEMQISHLQGEWQNLLRHGQTGALSYGDVLEADLYSEEEAMHTIYLLSEKTGNTMEACNRWVENLIKDGIKPNSSSDVPH